MTIRILLSWVLLLIPGMVYAQGTVQQLGTVVPGHIPMWSNNGRIMDAGGSPGAGMQPANKANAGTLPTGVSVVNSGLGYCAYSAYASAAYKSLCFGFDGSGNGLIDLEPVGGGSTPVFYVRIAGATFPLTGSTTLGGCPDIRFYGGNGDGITDNTAALTAALAVNTAIPCVFFPPGDWHFDSQYTYDFLTDGPGLQILGSGQGVTTLSWASGGLWINYKGYKNSVTVSGLTMTTSQPAGGDALTLHQTSGVAGSAAAAPTILSDLTIRGSDGPAGTNYWNTGVLSTSVINVSFRNVFISGDGALHGKGVDLEGSVALHAAVFNFTASTFICLDKGIIYGTQIEGVNVGPGNNFTCGNIGVWAPAGGAGQDQLTVVGSQFEVSQHGIYDQSGVNGKQITGNLFITDTAGSDGYNQTANATVTITGNEFQSGTATGAGINIGSGTALIANNTFVNQGTDIILGAGTGSVRVPDTNNHVSPIVTAITNGNAGNIVDGVFSWTPTLVGLTAPGAPTYTAQIGSYARSGNSIQASFTVAGTALGGATGSLTIQGLAFANFAGGFGSCNVTGGGPQIAAGTGSAQFIQLSGVINPGTSIIDLYLGSDATAGALVALADTAMNATFNLFGTCHYIAG